VYSCHGRLWQAVKGAEQTIIRAMEAGNGTEAQADIEKGRQIEEAMGSSPASAAPLAPSPTPAPPLAPPTPPPPPPLPPHDAGTPQESAGAAAAPALPPAKGTSNGTSAAAAATYSDPAAYAAAVRKWLAGMPQDAPPPSPGAALPSPESVYDHTKCAVVLDVRTQSEWDQGHITCAAHLEIPAAPAGWEAAVLALAGGVKTTPIVVYCHSGVRAARSVEMLQAAGFAGAVNGGGFTVSRYVNATGMSDVAALEDVCQACGAPRNSSGANSSASSVETFDYSPPQVEPEAEAAAAAAVHGALHSSPLIL
jgi:rhodanese-related sulfurtransferase